MLSVQHTGTASMVSYYKRNGLDPVPEAKGGKSWRKEQIRTKDLSGIVWCHWHEMDDFEVDFLSRRIVVPLRDPGLSMLSTWTRNQYSYEDQKRSWTLLAKHAENVDEWVDVDVVLPVHANKSDDRDEVKAQYRNKEVKRLPGAPLWALAEVRREVEEVFRIAGMEHILDRYGYYERLRRI